MADIFMILLVFLLKNYSTSLTNLAPSSQVSLPELAVTLKSTPRETLKVEIGKEAVLIDQKVAVKLNKYQFPPNEIQQSTGSPTVARILGEQRSLRPEPNRDSALVVMADQGTPYSTIKRVIASAAGAGFVDLQLVVVDPQQ